jgi:neurofibromin 1
VDDDLIYQILVALRGALAIFNDTDASLIVSIMMCLSNIIDHLSPGSRYLHALFWLAIGLVEMNHPATFPGAVRFLQAVLRALDNHGLFDDSDKKMADVLLEARAPLVDVARELDRLNGISFDTHFSFALATILLRQQQQDNADDDDVVYECLTTFLEIDGKKDGGGAGVVDAAALGYFVGLLPLAAKTQAVRDLFRLAGLDTTLDHQRLFDTLDIPDNTTALLLVSFLVCMLHTNKESLFLYQFLADASVAIPEVFALVYDSLLPRMNQMAISSQSTEVIDAVKAILMTACSDPAFQTSGKSQKHYLDELGFGALGAMPSKTTAVNAQLLSQLLERITE